MTWFGLAKSWLSASLCWTRGASGSRGCNQNRRGSTPVWRPLQASATAKMLLLAMLLAWAARVHAVRCYTMSYDIRALSDCAAIQYIQAGWQSQCLRDRAQSVYCKEDRLSDGCPDTPTVQGTGTICISRLFPTEHIGLRNFLCLALARLDLPALCAQESCPASMTQPSRTSPAKCSR